jgi:hypothetical protein
MYGKPTCRELVGKCALQTALYDRPVIPTLDDSGIRNHRFKGFAEGRGFRTVTCEISFQQTRVMVVSNHNVQGDRLLRCQLDIPCHVAVSDREPHHCAGPGKELVEQSLQCEVPDRSAVDRQDPIASLHPGP